MSSMLSGFQFHFKHPILERVVAVGNFIGDSACLAVGCSGGKVLIHDSNYNKQRAVDETNIHTLNFNEEISALEGGSVTLPESKPKSILFVGGQSHLIGYNVEENVDLFYKEIADGISAMATGTIPLSASPLCILGGNCSVQGYDYQGNEAFWTVTGDNVTSLCVCDVNGDGKNEMIVGSEDFDIRVFSNEEVISEISESDKIVQLCPVIASKFGYSLTNGTIGIYDNTVRVWRARSKHRLTSIHSYDYDGDGVPELVSGWSSGKLEIRSEKSGVVLSKDQLPSPVAAITQANYHQDADELICCSVDGEVRGYKQMQREQQALHTEHKIQQEEEELEVLSQQKQELLTELKHYKENLKLSESHHSPRGSTAVSSSFVFEGNKLVLQLKTNNGSPVRGAVIFAEQIFMEESLIYYPKHDSEELKVVLPSFKNQAADLFVKVLVGAKSSTYFQVCELVQKMPKFACYSSQKISTDISSYVTFKVHDRVNRVIMWMNQSFLTEHALDNQLDESFVNIKNNLPLRLSMRSDGQVTLKTEDIESAGEIIQDLCEFLQVTTLESTAFFPQQMQLLHDTLIQMNEYNQIRTKLITEIADSSNLIKTLLIRAEDCRLLNELHTANKIYFHLLELNEGLYAEHSKREQNLSSLMKSLKEINAIIQHFANLRVGKIKNHIIVASKNAIKTENLQDLMQIFKFGKKE